jgi:hypothetical protein
VEVSSWANLTESINALVSPAAASYIVSSHFTITEPYKSILINDGINVTIDSKSHNITGPWMKPADEVDRFFMIKGALKLLNGIWQKSAIVYPMNELGGGALITGTLIANNCLFEEMSSLGGAGGFSLSESGARAEFTECEFRDLSALSLSAGVVYVAQGASAWFKNCTFLANTAYAKGGGVAYVESKGAVYFQGCSFLECHDQLGYNDITRVDSSSTVTFLCPEGFEGSVELTALESSCKDLPPANLKCSVPTDIKVATWPELKSHTDALLEGAIATYTLMANFSMGAPKSFAPVLIDKGINVTIIGAGQVLDAGRQDRFFEVIGLLTLSSVVLLNGGVSNPSAHRGGAAISILGGANLVDVTFEDCTAAASGGALAVGQLGSGWAHLTNCTFQGTSSDANGGAISHEGLDLILDGCTFNNSIALGKGGALYAHTGCNAEITGCTYVTPSAIYNGSLSGVDGIAREDSSANITFSCAHNGVGVPVSLEGLEAAAAKLPPSTLICHKGESCGSSSCDTTFKHQQCCIYYDVLKKTTLYECYVIGQAKCCPVGGVCPNPCANAGCY